jgi:hypothetical protein
MLELFAYLFLLLGYGLLLLKILAGAQHIVSLSGDVAIACALGLVIGWRIVNTMMT